MLFTLITDRYTNSVQVENPVFRTTLTNLVLPIPNLTSNIGGFNSRTKITSSIFQGETGVARQTITSKLIPSAAIITYRSTNVLIIEICSVSTFLTLSSNPSLAERISIRDKWRRVYNTLTVCVDDVSLITCFTSSRYFVPCSAVI